MTQLRDETRGASSRAASSLERGVKREREHAHARARARARERSSSTHTLSRDAARSGASRVNGSWSSVFPAEPVTIYVVAGISTVVCVVTPESHGSSALGAGATSNMRSSSLSEQLLLLRGEDAQTSYG